MFLMKKFLSPWFCQWLIVVVVVVVAAAAAILCFYYLGDYKKEPLGIFFIMKRHAVSDDIFSSNWIF